MVIQLPKQNVTSFFSTSFNQNAVTQKIGAYHLRVIQLEKTAWLLTLFLKQQLSKLPNNVPQDNSSNQMRKCIQHRIHNNTEIPSILLDLPKEGLSILMMLVLEKLKQDWESQVWVQSETLQEEAKSCGVAERCSLPSMLQVQDAQDPGFHLDTVKTNLKCLSTASQSSQGSLFHHMLRVQGLLFFHFQGWVFLCQSPSYTVQCLRGETMMHFNKGAIANWEGAEHIWSKRTFLEHWNVTGFALLGLGLALGSCHPLLGLPFVVVLPTLWLTIVGFWKHVGLQLERNFASGWIRLSLTFPWFRWLVRRGYQI